MKENILTVEITDMPFLHQSSSNLKAMVLQLRAQHMELTQLEWTVTMCSLCIMPQKVLETSA